MDFAAVTLLWATCSLLLLMLLTAITKKTIWPVEIWLMGLGILYGLSVSKLPSLSPHFFWPHPKLQASTVTELILPILIFNSARVLPLKILQKQSALLAFLVLPGLLIAAAGFGYGFSLLFSWPLPYALMLGLAFAATDPTALGPLLEKVKLPKAISTLMEGESLLNDATAVICFTLLNNMLHGTESFLLILARGLFSIAGAVFVGTLIGQGASTILARAKDVPLFFPLSLTLFATAGSMMLSTEILNFSGPITVFFCAISFHRGYKKLHAVNQLHPELFHGFWQYIATLANGFLFFSLGYSLSLQTFDLAIYTWGYTFLLTIVLATLSRFILVYSTLALSRFHQTQGFNARALMTWAGMRGGVTIALIMSLEETNPYKEQMLSIAFALCLWQMIVHPIIVKRLCKQTATNCGLTQREEALN